MIFGSVCSGIEAASVAWHPLGWRARFFSEIEKFPSAVLAHRYGSNMPGEPYSENGTPNYGDMTKFREWPDADLDVLVGGTPCQSYSVAGLRAGLDDPRGDLTLTYAAIACRYRPRWLVWENVPGVLSIDEGRAFASLLGLLTGRRIEVPAGGWKSAGAVGGYGRAYGVAWRVLDAQFVRVDGFSFAVPQRRRRVFVIGCLGDWRGAAAVLFERESVCGNSAPRREAGKRAAPTISARPTGGGGLGTNFDLDGGLLAYSGNNTSGAIDVAAALNAKSTQRQDFETETLIAFSAKDSGNDAEFDLSPTLRAGGFTGSHANAGIMPAIAIQERAISENPNAGPDGAGVRDDGAAYTLEARTVPQAIALADSWAVRRLMPVECERLQAFPDNYTQIPWRGGIAPDGPRYKALGNSMAVNVMRWIGKRIELVEELIAKEKLDAR